MGYGSRALDQLKRYFKLEIPSVEETERPQESIESIQAEELDLLEEVIGKIFHQVFLHFSWFPNCCHYYKRN
jgi:hypothetical protein